MPNCNQSVPDRVLRSLQGVVRPEQALQLAEALLSLPQPDKGGIDKGGIAQAINQFHRQQRERPPALKSGKLAELHSALRAAWQELSGPQCRPHLQEPLIFISFLDWAPESAAKVAAQVAQQVELRQARAPVSQVRLWLDVSRTAAQPLPQVDQALLGLLRSVGRKPTAGLRSAAAPAAASDIEQLFTETYERIDYRVAREKRSLAELLIAPDFVSTLDSELKKRLPQTGIAIERHCDSEALVRKIPDKIRLFEEAAACWLRAEPLAALPFLRQLACRQGRMEREAATDLRHKVLAAAEKSPNELPIFVALSPLTGALEGSFAAEGLTFNFDSAIDPILSSSFFHLSGTWSVLKDSVALDAQQQNDLLRELLWLPLRRLLIQRASLAPIAADEENAKVIWPRPTAALMENGITLRDVIDKAEPNELQHLIASCGRRLQDSLNRGSQWMQNELRIEGVGLIVASELAQQPKHSNNQAVQQAFRELLCPFTEDLAPEPG